MRERARTGIHKALEDSYCTDENAVFRCDSDKNSLVISCLYLKVHFLKKNMLKL